LITILYTAPFREKFSFKTSHAVALLKEDYFWFSCRFLFQKVMPRTVTRLSSGLLVSRNPGFGNLVLVKDTAFV
jgi:hypothetical protein